MQFIRQGFYVFLDFSLLHILAAFTPIAAFQRASLRHQECQGKGTQGSSSRVDNAPGRATAAVDIAGDELPSSPLAVIQREVSSQGPSIAGASSSSLAGKLA